MTYRGICGILKLSNGNHDDTGESGERKKIMDTYYMKNKKKIDENMEIIPASSYCPGEAAGTSFSLVSSAWTLAI